MEKLIFTTITSAIILIIIFLNFNLTLGQLLAIGLVINLIVSIFYDV